MGYPELVEVLKENYANPRTIDRVTLDAITGMSEEKQKELFRELIISCRSETDSKYELLACDIVNHRVQQMIPYIEGLSQSDARKLTFVSAFYKAEMIGAPSGILEFDSKTGTSLFNRAQLDKSRSDVAALLDRIFPGEGYGDIIMRRGRLGGLLKIADDFNGMTNEQNPAKFYLEMQSGKRQVRCEGELYDITGIKASVKAGKWTLAVCEVGNPHNIREFEADQRELLKNSADAVKEIRSMVSRGFLKFDGVSRAIDIYEDVCVNLRECPRRVGGVDIGMM